VANTREGNVGGHTLSQDLGPLHRFQRCGGLDRQCDLVYPDNLEWCMWERRNFKRKLD
jgi:hypothetical protein